MHNEAVLLQAILLIPRIGVLNDHGIYEHSVS